MVCTNKQVGIGAGVVIGVGATWGGSMAGGAGAAHSTVGAGLRWVAVLSVNILQMGNQQPSDIQKVDSSLVVRYSGALVQLNIRSTPVAGSRCAVG